MWTMNPVKNHLVLKAGMSEAWKRGTLTYAKDSPSGLWFRGVESLLYRLLVAR